MADEQRRAYINSILEHKFADNDLGSTRERLFLESLPTEELKELNDEIILEN